MAYDGVMDDIRLAVARRKPERLPVFMCSEEMDVRVCGSRYDRYAQGYHEALSGPGHLLDRMKGFWTYFGVHFKGGAALSKRIHRTFHLPGYLDVVSRFFEEDAEWVG